MGRFVYLNSGISLEVSDRGVSKVSEVLTDNYA